MEINNTLRMMSQKSEIDYELTASSNKMLEHVNETKQVDYTTLDFWV